MNDEKIKLLGSKFAIAGVLIATISATALFLKLYVLDLKNEQILELQQKVVAIQELGKTLTAQNQQLLNQVNQLQAETIHLRTKSSPSRVRDTGVNNGSMPPKQEAHGSRSTNIIQEGAGSIDVRIEGDGVKLPSYDEPTELEMKRAIISLMKMRGGTETKPDTIAAENILAGAAVEIMEFEKLGCNAAAYGAGYFCNYRSKARMSFYSNEGTTAGDKHAQGVNMLMKFLMGGRDSSTETSTRRFIKGKNGWIASTE